MTAGPELVFQNQVRDLCRARRLLVYHTHDSRRSDAGFPDLVIVGANGVLFRELKSEKGRVRPEQTEWITVLQAAGCDAGIWRPSQLQTDVLRDLARLGPIQQPLLSTLKQIEKLRAGR